MFLDKTTEEEFFASLEGHLNKNHSFDSDLKDRRVSDLNAYLKHAASALARAGLRKEAECVEMVAAELNDPSVRGLTSDKMLNNLEHKGWVFNADDHNADSCMTADCMYCMEGEQPQLSQQELKKLRELLG